MENRQWDASLMSLKLPVADFLEHERWRTNSTEDDQKAPLDLDQSHWRRKPSLGWGTYGHVWLQERDAAGPRPHARAVKEIALSRLSIDGIDHQNEILHMARFSKLKVPKPCCGLFG